MSNLTQEFINLVLRPEVETAGYRMIKCDQCDCEMIQAGDLTKCFKCDPGAIENYVESIKQKTT